MGVPVRVWTIAAVLAVVMLLGLGWLLGASPYLTQAGAAEDERAIVETQNDLLRIELQQLQQESESIDELRDELKELSREFPSSAEYESAIDELIAGLVSTELSLTALSFSEPSIVPGPDGSLADTGEAIPAGTLIEIPLSIQVQGELSATLKFIDGLQQSTRFAFVESFSFAGGESSSASISARLYVIVSEARSPDVVEETPAEETTDLEDPEAGTPEDAEGNPAPEE